MSWPVEAGGGGQFEDRVMGAIAELVVCLVTGRLLRVSPQEATTVALESGVQNATMGIAVAGFVAARAAGERVPDWGGVARFRPTLRCMRCDDVFYPGSLRSLAAFGPLRSGRVRALSFAVAHVDDIDSERFIDNVVIARTYVGPISD